MRLGTSNQSALYRYSIANTILKKLRSAPDFDSSACLKNLTAKTLSLEDAVHDMISIIYELEQKKATARFEHRSSELRIRLLTTRPLPPASPFHLSFRSRSFIIRKPEITRENLRTMSLGKKREILQATERQCHFNPFRIAKFFRLRLADILPVMK